MRSNESSQQQRARVVAQWKSSGKTAREFASAHGYTAGSLYKWANEARQREVVPRGFVEVPRTALRGGDARAPMPIDNVIEVVLAGGRIVRVRGGFDVELFTAVVRTLEALC